MGTKLDRKDVKIFANNSDATLITEFRTESEDGSTASFSRDPDVIQNANYEQGWVENQNNLNTKIFGEDMNAVSYVQSYLLKYLYENGIPEWSSTTEYFEHSIARVDNRLFISLTDNNLNNDPTNTVGEWAEVPLSAINIITSGSGSSIFNTSSGNNITLKSLSVDGYASLQDNGDQLNIHVIGGSGIVDAYWGQIQGTLTNQTDLVSALGAKQDNLTFDTPLSKDVNNEVSIPKATDSINGYLDATDFQTFAGKQDALGGFTHSYDTDTDTAELYPTATNSNIGTSTYPITNVNASNVNASAITTTGSVTVGGNLGVTGSGRFDTIEGNTTTTKIETQADITPYAPNTYDLGSSVNYYAEAYAKNVYTDKIDNLTSGGDVEIGASIVPDTTNIYTLGSINQGFNELYIKTLKLTDADAQTEKIRCNARFQIDNGTSGLSFGFAEVVPFENEKNNLGSTSIKFRNLYILNINGSPYSPSDRNKKENIVERGTRKDGGSSLKSINNIKTYNYNFKSEADKSTHIGIMAQELREVEPLLVVDRAEDGSKQEDLYIDVMGYITLLTESIKELNSKVETLEARIEKLEGGAKGEEK